MSWQRFKSICKVWIPNRIWLIYKNSDNKRRRKKFYNLGRYSYAISPMSVTQDTKVGDFVSIACGVQIGLGNHPMSFLSLSPFTYHLKSDEDANLRIKELTSAQTNSGTICIGNDVWIGTNAIIMNGLSIGNGAVIGANAVITHDVEPYSVVGGVPGKMIKKRFDEKTIQRIEASKWWNLPDCMITDLPMDNVDEALNIIEKRKKEKRNKLKVCFIVISCIFPEFKNDIVCSTDEKCSKTIETVKSIREYCPDSYIVLIDNGVKNPADKLERYANEFIYLGNDWLVKKTRSAKNKGLGEAVLLLKTVRKRFKIYDLIFKIDGGYRLTEQFDVAEYDINAFNFLNYSYGKVVTNTEGYRTGNHSMRMYAFPGSFLERYCRGIRKAIILCMFGKSIEVSLPQVMKKAPFFYHKALGLTGKADASGDLIKE